MANLRFRVLPRFPARLFADGGLKITKAGADWTVSPDWGTLSVLSSISDSANTEVWVRVTSAGVSTYFRMTLAALISSLAQTGAGYSFVFTFDTTTTDADPGNGKLRLNQATQNTATVAYVDLADAGGVDITAILDSLTAGQFSLSKVGDSTKRLLGTLSTVTVVAGYRKLAIAITGFSSASPFSNGDSVLFQYVKSGTGIVTGSVDNAVLRADGVGGNTSQGSAITLDDNGVFTVPEASSPSSPAADKLALFAKDVGGVTRPCVKDSAGAEHDLIAGIMNPGGRLTLTTVTPVLTATVSGATSVIYAFHVHDKIPIYDGASWHAKTFTELSQATTDTTKSPAAVANNSNYDVFGWDDAGTLRATRGPVWTSDTGRGTGAGTTELERVNGVLVNKIAITNGPAAQRGTYLGTIRSNGSAQIDYIFGAAAAGGTAGLFGVFNAYNRVNVYTTVTDTTDSHAYALDAWRAWNAGAGMRVSAVFGLAEDGVSARSIAFVTSGAAQNSGVAIGLDSTSVPSGMIGPGLGSNSTTCVAEYSHPVTLGFHFWQLLESANGTNSSTFFGDNGGDNHQSGISLSLRL